MVLGIVLAATLPIVISIICTPLYSKIAHRHGHTDKPDHNLKQHRESVPHIGGIAIITAVGVTLAVLRIGAIIPAGQSVSAVIVTALLIFALGVLDDSRHLSVLLRLIVQCALALTLAVSGTVISFTDIVVVDCILTAIGIVAGINAINLMDIMDGLAGGVCLIAVFGIYICQVTIGIAPFYQLLSLALIGSLLVFLGFNFSAPPRKVFLGDGGSTLLGLIGAVLLINNVSLPNPSIGRWSVAAANVLFLSIPMFELLFVSIMRMRKGLNPLKGSNDHFPLRLSQLLNSKHQAIIRIYLCSVLVVGMGILLLFISAWYIIPLGIVALVLYGTIWYKLSRIEIS